jgi:hypothetical protein
MSDSDYDTLVCWRCSRGRPHVASTMAYCAECREAVWVANSSPRPIYRVLCIECTERELLKSGTIVVRPLSKEQMDDIRAYMRKQGEN